MKKTLLTLVSVLAIVSFAYGQLFTFEFTGSPSGDNQFNEVTSQPANATVSPITRTGVNFDPGDNVFDSINWGLGISRDENNYLSVTIAADPGYTMTFDGLRYDFSRDVGGPRNLQVLAFVNGSASGTVVHQFSFVIGLFEIFAGNNDVTFGSPLTDVSLAEFRFFGYNAPLFGGHLSFDNVGLTGSITPVPEPHQYAAVAGVVLLGFAVWHRRAKAAAGL